MRKQTLSKAMLAFMAGAAFLSACVDDKYDLSNLDTTIQVGSSGTLKLPQCSTGDIVLDNLFSLKDNGPITTIKGPDGQELYYLDKDGEASPDPINVEQINIRKPDDKTFNATMNLKELIGVKAASTRKGSPINRGYRYDISDRAKAEITGAQATNINADVVDIDRISFKDEVTVTLRIDISGENIDIINRLHFDSLSLHLPKGLELTSCKYLNQEKLGTNELRTKAQTDGIIVLVDGEDTNGYQLAGDPLMFQLTLKAANIAEGLGVTFDANNHSARLQGQFQITGFAGLNTAQEAGDLNYTALYNKFMTVVNQMDAAQKIEALQKLTNGDYSQAIETLLPHTLNFDGKCSFNSDMTVETFSGALQHAIDKIDDIDLGNLPDFLTDDGVTLDLTNPQLYLDFYTDLQTEISTQISLLPKYGTDTKPGVTANIQYFGSGDDKGKHKVFLLAPKSSDVVFPEAYAAYNQNRQDAPVGNLIRQIPDVIKVTGTDGNEQIIVSLPHCENIKISQSYKVELRYRVFSPLTFGNDFQIIYRDKEENLDLGDDLDDLNVESLLLTGVAHSDIPLSLNLNVIPLNKKGKDLSNGLVIEYKNSGDADFQRTGVKIRANANGGEQDKFSIRIKAEQGHKLNEFLHTGEMQLDGIEYVAKLNDPSSNADALNTADKLWLTNIQISATGVSYLAHKDDK